jgi:hypothetical protein
MGRLCREKSGFTPEKSPTQEQGKAQRGKQNIIAQRGKEQIQSPTRHQIKYILAQRGTYQTQAQRGRTQKQSPTRHHPKYILAQRGTNQIQAQRGRAQNIKPNEAKRQINTSPTRHIPNISPTRFKTQDILRNANNRATENGQCIQRDEWVNKLQAFTLYAQAHNRRVTQPNPNSYQSYLDENETQTFMYYPSSGKFVLGRNRNKKGGAYHTKLLELINTHPTTIMNTQMYAEEEEKRHRHAVGRGG